MFTRIRQFARAATQRVPRYLLIPLLLAPLGIAGYLSAGYVRLEHHYQEAVKALAQESFDEAGSHLAVCLNLAPRSGRVYFLAAQTARRSGQFDAAREKLEISQELGWLPDAVAHEEHLLTFQRGDFDAGIEQYLRACLTPTNPERRLVLEALALGYMKTYRLVPALECLDIWLEEQPDAIGARLRRGWVHERLDRPLDAEKDYRHVLGCDAKHRAGRLHLAKLLRHEGKLGDALPLFEALRAEEVDDFLAAVGLAQCYAGLGRTEEARALLDELSIRRPQDPTVLLERGRLALGLGRIKEARHWLERAALSAPQDYETHYQLFLCLRRLGADAEARDEEKQFKAIEADLKLMNDLTDQLQKAPNNPDLRLKIAQIFLRRGEEKEGAIWLQGVVQLDARRTEAHRLLAQHYERSGSPARARVHRQYLIGGERIP